MCFITPQTGEEGSKCGLALRCFVSSELCGWLSFHNSKPFYFVGSPKEISVPVMCAAGSSAIPPIFHDMGLSQCEYIGCDTPPDTP